MTVNVGEKSLTIKFRDGEPPLLVPLKSIKITKDVVYVNTTNGHSYWFPKDRVACMIQAYTDNPQWNGDQNEKLS